MELKIYPDEVLRKKCAPLREVGDEEAHRMRQMLDLMYEEEGVGLAGPQVGWSVRVLTLDVEQDGSDPRIFINPRLVESEGQVEEEEGCLSLPGLSAAVPRAERVRVVAFTLQGKRYEVQAEGLPARAWQHEIDHLNGILFIDRLSPTKRLGLRHRLKELEKMHAKQPAGTA
jgi:peptide deformylase